MLGWSSITALVGARYHKPIVALTSDFKQANAADRSLPLPRGGVLHRERRAAEARVEDARVPQLLCLNALVLRAESLSAGRACPLKGAGRAVSQRPLGGLHQGLVAEPALEEEVLVAHAAHARPDQLGGVVLRVAVEVPAVPVDLPTGGLLARRDHDVEVLSPAVDRQVHAGQLQVRLLQLKVSHNPVDVSLPRVEAGREQPRLLEERGELPQDLLAAPGHRAVHRLHDQRAALQERPAHSESKQR
mmetsp:Transcript_11111/g.34430  ORF Transcript_11111/g.34430 Transcript_11111/m.34430 type:complete len:246 (+) Transcript_11111:352-1089(+)